MNYKRPNTDHLPEWLQDGPVWCRANNDRKVLIVWYGTDEHGEYYLDVEGQYWSAAEPIEAWQPHENEPVIAWDIGYRRVDVIEYNQTRVYDHIARMPDHRLESLEVEYIKSLNLEEL